jgi:hypothetical protein
MATFLKLSSSFFAPADDNRAKDLAPSVDELRRGTGRY